MEKTQAVCPSCSPNVPVSHTVLKNTKEMLLKCKICNTVHKHKKPREVGVRVIVSKGGVSFQSKAMLSGTIRIGDEFIVDDESIGEATLVQVTSIEVGNKRERSASAEDIKTIWARDVDEVTVKISLPKGKVTQSIEMKVDGNKEFVVGEKLRLDHKELRIKQIKLKKGSFKRKKGVAIAAKYIHRIYVEADKPVKTSKNIIRDSVWSLRSRRTGWSRN